MEDGKLGNLPPRQSRPVPGRTLPRPLAMLVACRPRGRLSAEVLPVPSVPDAPMPPLAIIGLGCLFPGSSDPAGFWSRIVNRVDAIRDVPPTHWRAEDYLDADPKSPDRVYAARGAFLDPVAFNPTAFGIPPSNLEATDASQLLGLVVAQQALE